MEPTTSLFSGLKFLFKDLKPQERTHAVYLIIIFALSGWIMHITFKQDISNTDRINCEQRIDAARTGQQQRDERRSDSLRREDKKECDARLVQFLNERIPVVQKRNNNIKSTIK